MKTLNHRNLTDTAEWVFLISKIADIEKDHVNDMILAAKDGNTAQVQFLAGQVQQLRNFAELPEHWMPEKKD